MWVIYQTKEQKIVGLSADCEPDLEKDFALQEVVRGLAHAEDATMYDALQVSDRTQAYTLLTTPLGRLALHATPEGDLEVVVQELQMFFLEVNCDAPEAHPVDGIPTISADGTSFATITLQKTDAQGKPRQSSRDNDLFYLRTDYGTLMSVDGTAEVASLKLTRGRAAFRLVSEPARRVATVQVFNADDNIPDRSIRIEFV